MTAVSDPRSVAVDLHIADRPGMEASGVGRYAIEATRALIAARPQWEFVVLTNRPELVEGTGAAVHSTRLPTERAAARVAWLHGAAIADRAARRADCWVSMAFTLPVWLRGPSVVTIHDLVFIDHDDTYSSRLRATYAARATRAAARRSSAVVCGSAETSDRLTAVLGTPRDRITVVPYGVSDAFQPAAAEHAAGTGGPILAVGTFEPRKGLDTLHAALRRLNDGRAEPVQLVLAGRPGWGAEDTVEALRADTNVTIVEGPSDAELAELYRRASLLAFPSRAEGFGLPVAEAMSSGCPVICSDLPSIREFAGDAPVYVPVGDDVALAAAVASMLNDAELRRHHVARGMELASGLRWKRVGDTIAGLVEKATA